MQIKTKYSVGDKVYVIQKGGLSNDMVRVELKEIRAITLEGSTNPSYDIGGRNYPEGYIYTDKEKARNEAKNEAKRIYNRNLQLINEQRLGEVEINSDD